MLKFEVTDDFKWMILVHYDQEIERRQLEISLTRKIHNWFFHPLVKKKKWDGNICFINKIGNVWKIPFGLWTEVFDIGEKFNIPIEIDGLEKVILEDFELGDFEVWVNNFFKDQQIKPRDYQINAAWKIIKYRYSISEIATSSGKTLIAFIVFAYLKKMGWIKRFMMVVPNTNLVIQGTEDFNDYNLSAIGSKIQQIGGGSKPREDCDIIIGTYQSLVKRGEDFFKDIDLIFVDEAHQTGSASIKKIISKNMSSKWRFGLSGTLTKRDAADHLTIQQYLGPLILEISSKFLFDNNYATPVKVKIINLNWLDYESKEKLSSLKANQNNLEGTDLYNIERRLVINSPKRLNYIVDLITRTTKNSLVLFQSVKDEYGKQIWKLIRERSNNKEVFYVEGETNESLREEYKTRMEKGNNKILVATFGTFSTGISINNLHNIFFVESYKSEVLIKQSVGRGMRKMKDKDVVNIIDFVDDFRIGGYENYLYKHSKERIEIYKKEKYNYQIFNINL